MDIQNTDTGIGLMWRGCNRCISERYRGPAGMISSSASTSRTAGLLGWDGMGYTDEDAVNDILGQIQTLAMKEYPRDLPFLFRGRLSNEKCLGMDLPHNAFGCIRHECLLDPRYLHVSQVAMISLSSTVLLLIIRMATTTATARGGTNQGRGTHDANHSLVHEKGVSVVDIVEDTEDDNDTRPDCHSRQNSHQTEGSDRT
eukprot:scaffold51799_cov56-Attheya_sp.AAC.4